MASASKAGRPGATRTGDRVMRARRFWAELKSSEFAALDPGTTLAILPVAAIEQHGPHLPVMTDTAIAEGMIETVLARLPNELRVRRNMLVATTQWRRLGLPTGLYGDFDTRHGIHAGDIETSLMLHFRPDLVDMGKAKLFPSKAADMERDYKHLRPAGQHGFGWIAQDLNAEGALGDAAAATAEKGRLTAEHQADAFIALLRDVARFPLDQLA